MQEPTTYRRTATRAARYYRPAAHRERFWSGIRAGHVFILSAFAAAFLSLPLLAAEKKPAPAAAPSVPATPAVSGASQAVIPGLAATPSALKTAKEAGPGQIIPVPPGADHAVSTPLSQILASSTQMAMNGPGSGAKDAHGSVYTVRETRTLIITPRSIIQMSHGVQPGRTKLSKAGSPGLLVKTYDVTYQASKPIRYKLISTKVVHPVQNRVLLAGIRTREARALPSRLGTYSRIREMDMLATGYSPYEGSSTGRCATGMRAGYGVVAVDPRVIPLGSRLYIEGYGYAIAGDTGGAIRHNRIDLGMNSYRQANDVGRRRVHVYVLSEMR